MGSRNFFDRIFSIEDLRKLINSIISSYNHLYILLHSRELSPYSSTSDILLVSTTDLSFQKQNSLHKILYYTTLFSFLTKEPAMEDLRHEGGESWKRRKKNGGSKVWYNKAV